MTFDKLIASYDYQFPPELIANAPAHPRESARLLIYDRNTEKVSFDTFENICDYLPKNAVLVFNRSRVIPAKFTLKKKTDGSIGALFLEEKFGLVRVLASGSFTIGDTLTWVGKHSFLVKERSEKEAILEPNFPVSDLINLLEQYGQTPLPPYIKNSPLTESERREEYQNVFAEDNGSVAAPTAGLHFSETLIKKVEQSGRGVAYLTLHVGLGTFAPLTEENWLRKGLHREYYDIDKHTAETLNTAKSENRPIIAVGTTTVRTLESALQSGKVTSGQGSTTLFLTEDSPIHCVDGLITNFHVPHSSLLMLVSAFTGREKLLKIYERAIAEKMRLFSFGDGMLIL